MLIKVNCETKNRNFFLFFFCCTGKLGSHHILLRNFRKKGLKSIVKWFTMVSSGRKWRVVVQNGEDIPVLEEGELHVERRIQS